MNSAVLSACGRYRYRLTRVWGTGAAATFVMLNPSTATAEANDATVSRCCVFARSWGCGSLVVVNLYAWRSRTPAALWQAADPVGPDNDQHLQTAAEDSAAAGGPLVAAWGMNARPDRVAAVLALPGTDRLAVLALTGAGHPRHPLYLPRDLTPVPWQRS